MSWKISNQSLSQQSLLNNESIFSVGNGYLGVRGNFEEGYGDGMSSIRGTYINAFHDITEIAYGEKLYGFPETQQKLVNIIDAQTVEIYIGEEEEKFSLFHGEVLSYDRLLHLDKGYVERSVHWKSPKGKEVKLTFQRLVSFTCKELFIINVKVEPVNFKGKVKIKSTIDGDVSNYVASNDPRIGSSHGKLLKIKEVGSKQACLYVLDETTVSKLETACSTKHTGNLKPVQHERKEDEKSIEEAFTFHVEDVLQFTKWNVYTDTLRHKDGLVEKGIALVNEAVEKQVSYWFQEQEKYVAAFWEDASMEIEGDERLQEGLRFNLFHLLQSVGRDPFSNIAAKGLSGEGYEGHYFWDTEIYMFPVFLMLKPDLAKNLLIFRYSKLKEAKEHAKRMGHRKGALFPWRTISGSECSGYFPSGSAQYHINADIAYSFIQYYFATLDLQFMKKFGFELLVETARIWLEIGHFHDGKFKMDEVTGPDEYTCLVNNNFYTNVMAKHHLTWTVKMNDQLKEKAPREWEELVSRLGLKDEEIRLMEQAANDMYLPYDEKLNINPQDDSFLEKAVWDFENTPKEHYPLLLHYHPLTIYRYQVCKQADTVLAHFLLEDEVDKSTIRQSFDYYEKVTTHDSSLSSCIFSMMAARLGYYDKAYDYFMQTARLDLDNTQGNTKDGLHMANMGGTWMAIVYGFAGFRLKEEGISFDPSIPKKWESYSFQIQYQGRKLRMDVTNSTVTLQLVAGEEISLKLYGEDITLKDSYNTSVQNEGIVWTGN